MSHILTLLLDLLTNHDEIAHHILSFGMANTCIASFLGGLYVIRRTLLRRNSTSRSRA